jgi:signal transduction histidine kinase
MPKFFVDFKKKFDRYSHKLTARKNCYHRLDELENLLISKDFELKESHQILKNKDENIEKQNQIIVHKEEELTEYINKIFEHQEKERIVKWIVDSIRESLDLDKVLETTVEKIGKLLKVDRCIITLYNEEKTEFEIVKVYRDNENITSITEKSYLSNVSPEWQKQLIEEKNSIVLNDTDKILKNKVQQVHFDKYNIKSFLITPIVLKDKILGYISIHQTQYQRDWNPNHIEILENISNQIAIAIMQASLYTQAQESTRLKSEFLAGMSHEFRTPLNAIIGFSEMLITPHYGAISQKQKEYLNNIITSGKHLLRLVNDILDLSKIESGNANLKYETFFSNKAIEETIFMLSTLTLQKNINLEYDLLNITINADITRFKQIMYNLINNAIKFTDNNGIISLTTTIKDNKLIVKIQDSGIGIAEEDKDKIFSQFMQVDSSYTRKQEGTGLGLALTKKLVELHNGVIDFKSESGKGTTFWFILPEAKLVDSIK